MGNFIPAGRLSAVDHGEQKIEIQTEFSKYPEPRIATSVSIAGRVIHKIQKQWGKTIDSLDEMREVETIMNKQHDEVTALVHEHAGTLVEHTKDKDDNAVSRAIVQKVQEIPEIISAFIISAEGKLHSFKKTSEEAEIMAIMIKSLTEILFDIARETNLGECQDCVLQLGEHDLLLLPFQGGYLCALTDPKVRKREVLEQLWKIAGAA